MTGGMRGAVIAALALLATPVAAAPATGSADARLRALYTAEYAWRKQQMPPSEDDDKNSARSLPDVGPAAQAAKLARWTQTATALASASRAAVSAVQASRRRPDRMPASFPVDGADIPS